MLLKDLIKAGIGEIKVDLVLKNCNLVNVNTREILEGDLAIYKGYIVGIGSVEDQIGNTTKIIDLNGRYVAPGLIDGHVHFESSMVTLSQFARVALKHGTICVIIDPHEIANVLGKKGIEMVLEEAKSLDLEVKLLVSSCVPATNLETSGAKIGLEEVKELLKEDAVIGLGEVMDYPSVISASKEKIGMIEETLKIKKVVDGHAPTLSGKELFGYLCSGISSDHEAITFEEALEKARLGMKVMLRDGSATSCISDFIPKLIDSNIYLENFFFVSDDKHPEDLIKGYMDSTVKKAIDLGLDPINAIAMCTINTAKHFKIDSEVGSISLGKKANLIVLDSLKEFKINKVFVKGKLINNKIETQKIKYPREVFNTIKYKDISPSDLGIKSNTSDNIVKVNVIEVIPNQIFTEWSIDELETKNGVIYPSIDQDILAICVIERHGKKVRRYAIGKGLVKGIGLKEGAFGTSVAHDSHNVVIVGTNFEDMALCANKIKALQGGIVISKNNKIIDSLALPYAGILSPDPVEEVIKKLKSLHKNIKEIGCRLESPFLVLSFLALPVIPRLKLTDLGLVDVENFKIIEVSREKEF
ncbi:MAG: adenine deaminase [Methanosarcinales archaeon]